MILDDMTLERIAELLDRAEDLDDSFEMSIPAAEVAKLCELAIIGAKYKITRRGPF